MDRLALFCCSETGKEDVMKTIYIRNVDSSVLAKIDELAEQKHISRNKLVNIILETYITTDKVKEIENNYSSLVETVTAAIQNNTIALNTIQLQINMLNKGDLK